MSGPVNCTSNSTQCSQYILQTLCIRLKPPEFPIWIQEVQKQYLLERCTSWKAYSALCLGLGETTTDLSTTYFTDVTTDEYDVNVTETDITSTVSALPEATTLTSPSLSSSLSSEDLTSAVVVTNGRSLSNESQTTDSIITNVTQSVANFNQSVWSETSHEDKASKSSWILPGVTFFIAALIIVFTILLYKWYRKYSLKYDLETQLCSNYKYLNQENRERGQKLDDVDVEKSVTFVPVDNEIFISENHKLENKTVFEENGNHDIVDLQTQSFGEDPMYVLPNSYTEVIHDDFDLEFSLPPLNLTTVGLKGTLETGFVNPAYEGTETISDPTVPRKKKKRRFSFLKILKKTRREK